MHLKDMALLKTARRGEAVFASVRLAPVYDALTTRVFTGLEHDRMALKLGGKDERTSSRRPHWRACVQPTPTR
jgi:serine/threonine-protein kinase HipA